MKYYVYVILCNTCKQHYTTNETQFARYNEGMTSARSNCSIPAEERSTINPAGIRTG